MRPRGLRPGLRLQIVLALAGLMTLAFGPLFFAVASLARATVAGAREESARALGRAIAAHVTDDSRGDAVGVERALREHIAPGVDAICAFARDGARLFCAGSPLDAAEMQMPAEREQETLRIAPGTGGRALEVSVPAGRFVVMFRLRTAADADRATPLVRLVALYTLVFALALLVFAYFALTRLIVRPVEQLAAATDRVASGARTLGLPNGGARELVGLGASVQAMAEKLIAEQGALRLKIEELTQTTTQLTETQAQLVRSERMASVGRLAAGLAHEIGNPIAALVGMEELLLGNDLPLETQQDFLRRMRSETERIHVVIRDLLDFARPEGAFGTGLGPQPPADVGEVIGDVVALVRPQKPFRDVRLETDVTDNLRVELPAQRLTQVLLNIVLNAGASIASGVRQEGRVLVRARAVEDGWVRIEVADDGPGIDASVRERLFEPFVTTKPTGEGTGLGLAVCRGLVESAGGQIGVDAMHTLGARFYVLLPAPRTV